MEGRCLGCAVLPAVVAPKCTFLAADGPGAAATPLGLEPAPSLVSSSSGTEADGRIEEARSEWGAWRKG